eukprot:1698517-Rhodomonas_salina.8
MPGVLTLVAGATRSGVCTSSGMTIRWKSYRPVQLLNQLKPRSEFELRFGPRAGSDVACGAGRVRVPWTSLVDNNAALVYRHSPKPNT